MVFIKIYMMTVMMMIVVLELINAAVSLSSWKPKEQEDAQMKKSIRKLTNK